jgi:hypothetical protein
MTCYLKVNCKLNKKLSNNGYLIGEICVIHKIEEVNVFLFRFSVNLKNKFTFVPFQNEKQDEEIVFDLCAFHGRLFCCQSSKREE